MKQGIVAALVVGTFMLLPAEAKAHHEGDDRLHVDAGGWCLHNRWGSGEDDRRINVAGFVRAGGYPVPNPEKMMVIWRVYFKTYYIDEDYTLIHKHREIYPSLKNDSIGLSSSYDSDPLDFQANSLRVLLTAELRWYFDGQVVRHRPMKLVEWIPRKAEDEAQRCQPRRIST